MNIQAIQILTDRVARKCEKQLVDLDFKKMRDGLSSFASHFPTPITSNAYPAPRLRTDDSYNIFSRTVHTRRRLSLARTYAHTDAHT